MSVFERLINTKSGTTTSVYDRLVPQNTSTSSSSVYDRLTGKSKEDNATSTPEVNPVKTPFAATNFGIGVNTVLGIPKAAYDISKKATDYVVNEGVKPFSKEGRTQILNDFQTMFPQGKYGPTMRPEDAVINLINPTGVSPTKLTSGMGIPKQFFKDIAESKSAEFIAGLLKKIGIGDKEIPTLSTKLADIADEAKVAEEINKTKSASLPLKPIEPALEKPLPKEPVETKLPITEKPPEVPATSPEQVISDTSQSLPNSSKTMTEKSISPEVENYIKEQVTKQGAAREEGAISGLKNKTTELYNTAKKKLVDFNAPIEDTLRAAEKKNKLSILPEYHITNQIDRVLRTPTIAGQFARDHGLETIIKEAPDLNTLDQYLIARQSVAVDTRGINTGRNLAMDEKLVRELGPQYEGIAQKVTKYSQDLLDYAAESGLVSKDTAALLKKRYPDYVPIKRIFSEMERNGGEFGSKAVASLSKQTVVQSLKGSSREIESPVKSLLEKTAEAFKQGEKNKAARILVSYKELPGNPFQLRELQKGETAAHTISFLDNGVKRTFETTKDIAEAAKALNVQQRNVLGNILAYPVRVAKVGITGINLPFIASNIVRDQITGVINSANALKTSIANPAVFLKSLFETVKHGEVYDEMVRNGAMGTSFDMARDQLPQTIDRIRAGKSVGSKIKYTVTHPQELLRKVENLIARSEELTRVQQYQGTKLAALKAGHGIKDAEVLASRAARENTVNFARRGEWGTVLNSAFLYLNAGIQGSRTFVRNFSQKPLQTAAKLAVTVFTPVAAATAWNLSDPKRKAAYDDIADYEKQNNIIIIPPNPTKNDDGTWNIIKIPLSQEVNNITGLIRRPIEQAYGENPVSVKDIASALVGAVSPIAPNRESVLSTLTPQAIKPSLESVLNKNIFTGLPIVPDSMNKLSPPLQYKPFTSGTARKVGELTNTSPLKIESFIKETFGGIGPQAINVIDNALAGANIIPKDQIGGQNVIKAIVSRFAEARGGQSERLNAELSKTLTSQADENFRITQEGEILYTSLKSLPKEEASKKFGELVKTNPLLAKKVSAIATDEKSGLNYADRMIKTLEVRSGRRAQYIVSELNALKTKEEKSKLYSEYINKKIITKEVAAQINSLLQK